MLRKLLIAITVAFCGQTKGNSMSEIRTYMPFTYPVDPVKIFTIPDMDVSKALGTTLVEWDTQKQISGALVDKWTIVGDRVYRLTIRKDAHWSNGQPLTAKDVKLSLEHGLKAHPEDLRSLSNILERIDCASLLDLDFHLKMEARESGLLRKLTEPNFGIFKLNKHGLLDLTISSGAFFLSAKSTQQELILEKNPNWYQSESVANVVDQVVIRRAPQTMDAQSILLNDPWPNLIETSSLIKEDLLQRYIREGFQIWRRPVDKVFLLKIGKRQNSGELRKLLQVFRQQTTTSDFAKGYSGVQPAVQLLPRGYQLFHKTFSCSKTDGKIPSVFATKPLEIVTVASGLSSQMQENIRSVVTAVTGVEPRFIPVSLSDMKSVFTKGDYDLFVGTVGLADPDPEGLMSFYLEGETPIIEDPENKFVERLDHARKEADGEARLSGMRSILRDAVCDGYVFPIFHLSTIGIARPNLDLSHAPESDESVTFSKVRIRNKK